jgi:hypothetical protein
MGIDEETEETEGIGLFVVFFQGKPHLAILSRPQ